MSVVIEEEESDSNIDIKVVVVNVHPSVLTNICLHFSRIRLTSKDHSDVLQVFGILLGYRVNPETLTIRTSMEFTITLTEGKSGSIKFIGGFDHEIFKRMKDNQLSGFEIVGWYRAGKGADLRKCSLKSPPNLRFHEKVTSLTGTNDLLLLEYETEMGEILKRFPSIYRRIKTDLLDYWEPIDFKFLLSSHRPENENKFVTQLRIDSMKRFQERATTVLKECSFDEEAFQRRSTLCSSISDSFGLETAKKKEERFLGKGVRQWIPDSSSCFYSTYEGDLKFGQGTVYFEGVEGKSYRSWLAGKSLIRSLRPSRIEGEFFFDQNSCRIVGNAVQHFVIGNRYKDIGADARYTGEFEIVKSENGGYECEQSGKGVMTYYNDGSIYKGDWMNGEYEGSGKFLFGPGSDGDLTMSQQHNPRKPFFRAGDVYRGDFKGGKFHGKGKLISKSGKYRYQGWFFHNLPSGLGTLEYEDGHESGLKKYVGHFKNFRMDGWGDLLMTDGGRYLGNFNRTMPSGKGSFFFKSGARYVGGFKKTKKHGEAVYYYPWGESYRGNFRNGKRTGKGYMFEHGDEKSEDCKIQVFEEFYVEGKKVRRKEVEKGVKMDFELIEEDLRSRIEFLTSPDFVYGDLVDLKCVIVKWKNWTIHSRDSLRLFRTFLK